MWIDAAGLGLESGQEEILAVAGAFNFVFCVAESGAVQTEVGFPIGLVAGRQPLGDGLVDGAVDWIIRIIGAKFCRRLAAGGNR